MYITHHIFSQSSLGAKIHSLKFIGEPPSLGLRISIRSLAAGSTDSRGEDMDGQWMMVRLLNENWHSSATFPFHFSVGRRRCETNISLGNRTKNGGGGGGGVSLLKLFFGPSFFQ